MKLVAISDTHNLKMTHDVPKGDVLIHAGDLTMDGTKAEVERAAQWLKSLPGDHKVCTAGNHDHWIQGYPREAVEYFKSQGIQLLLAKATVIDGVKFFGSPWTKWFYNWAFNFPQEDLIDMRVSKDHWAQIHKGTDVVITHGPPYKILDRVNRPRPKEDPHVGDRQLRWRIELVEPKVHVFGHIHEQYGHFRNTGQTGKIIDYYNASTCTGHYRPTNPPVIINL